MRLFMNIFSLLFSRFDYWILQTIAMSVTAFLLPGLRITQISGALFTVLAISYLNSTVWDTALFFQIPDTFSLQVCSLILTNGVLFWILVKILPGIEIEGFLPALVAPLVFTISSFLIDKYGTTVDWKAVFSVVANVIRQIRDHFLNVNPEEESEAFLIFFRAFV